MKQKRAIRPRTSRDPLADRVAARLLTLGAGEAAVTKFFLENRDDVPLMSATEIAARMKVATATVVRAAQSLGYSGFPELKRELRETLRARGSRPVHVEYSMPSATDADPAVMAERTAAYQADLLHKAHQSIKGDEFARAVDLLATAPHVGVIDFGLYAGIAEHFAKMLRWFGRRVFEIRGRADAMTEDLLALTAGDLVVVLGYGRLSKEIAVVLDELRERKVKCVVIADAMAAPLKSREVVVLSADRGGPHPFESATVPLAVLETLLFALAGHDAERVQATLARDRELRRRLRSSRAERS